MNQNLKVIVLGVLLSIFSVACGGKEPAVYYSTDKASSEEPNPDYVNPNWEYDANMAYGNQNQVPPVTNNQQAQQPNNQNQQTNNYDSQPKAPVATTGIEKYLTQLYQNLYGRNPDLNGFTYWVNGYESGASGCEAITHSFLYGNDIADLRNSAVGGNRTAKLAYLTALYRGVLGRTPDTAGRNYYIAELDKGMSINQLDISFLKSDEFKRRCSSFGLAL